MNRAITAITITAIGAILLAWAPSMAYAGAPSNGATITKDFGCFINLGGHFGTTDEMSRTVVNNNREVLTCHFTGITNPPTETEIFKGWGCSTFSGGTTNTFFIVNPSGNGMIRCIVDI